MTIDLNEDAVHKPHDPNVCGDCEGQLLGGKPLQQSAPAASGAMTGSSP